MATHPTISKTRPSKSAVKKQNAARSNKSTAKTPVRTATAKKQATASTGKSKTGAGGRQSRTGQRATKKSAAREAAPSLSLRPIREHQNRSQIIAMVAAGSGVAAGTVERVARSLSQTLTRHLIRGGSGRVEIPYLGAALWRGRTAAQKARTMLSPVLGRTVSVPARRSQPAARLRTHRLLRDAVARR